MSLVSQLEVCLLVGLVSETRFRVVQPLTSLKQLMTALNSGYSRLPDMLDFSYGSFRKLTDLKESLLGNFHQVQVLGENSVLYSSRADSTTLNGVEVKGW